jgi:hypothetical protein
MTWQSISASPYPITISQQCRGNIDSGSAGGDADAPASAPATKGVNSSTFQLNSRHFLWDTLSGITPFQ